MLEIDQKMNKLFTVLLAVACAAIVFIWPQWRTTLKAQGYYITEELQISAVIYPDSGTRPLETDFTFTIESGTPPFTYTLDYGDGSTDSEAPVTSTTRNYSYTYSTPGSYIAQITVTDADSQTITQAFNIQVNDTVTSDNIILTDTLSSATITAGSDKKVYSTTGTNSITLESGAKATLLNFPGRNTITIQADSSLFVVSRSGATVTFEGEDGTVMRIAATKTPQTIIFSDCTGFLSIVEDQIMLSNQIVSTLSSSITFRECGAYIAPGVWKKFDCYNLAAIGKTSGDDPFTLSWRLIGGYWQWGRKGPDSSQWYNTNTPNFAHGPTGPDEADANDDEITGWEDNSYASDDAWGDADKTADDPCPSGYRVPTKAQWEGVNENNTQYTVGTWSSDESDATNYSSGRFFGDDLMLPATGKRHYGQGLLSYRGKYGHYWSSTGRANYSYTAWYLNFTSSVANTSYNDRKLGFAVRCVAE